MLQAFTLLGGEGLKRYFIKHNEIPHPILWALPLIHRACLIKSEFAEGLEYELMYCMTE